MGVARAELPFQLLPDFLGERRTLPRSRNCNLQITALNHGRIIEIALLGNIHHVAENATGLCLEKNKLIHLTRRCRHHNEEDIVQI